MKKLIAVALSFALVASIPAYGQSKSSDDKPKNSISGWLKPVTLKKNKKPEPPKCNKPTKKNKSPTNPCVKSSSYQSGGSIVIVGLDRKIFIG